MLAVIFKNTVVFIFLFAQNAEITDQELTCTLFVRCDIILNNINRLDSEKVDIVPADGVIFMEKMVP